MNKVYVQLNDRQFTGGLFSDRLFVSRMCHRNPPHLFRTSETSEGIVRDIGTELKKIKI